MFLSKSQSLILGERAVDDAVRLMHLHLPLGFGVHLVRRARPDDRCLNGFDDTR